MTLYPPTLYPPIMPVMGARAPMLPWDSCCRTNGSEGTAPGLWTPAQLGSALTLWLDERGQVGSPISPWNDQSGAGNNFTGPGSKPTTGDTINGYASPRFTLASAQFLQSNALSAFITATQYHILAVVKAVTVPNVVAGPSAFYTGNGIFGDLTGGYTGLVAYDTAGTKYAAFGGFDSGGHAAQDVIPVGSAVLLEGWLTTDKTLHLRVGSNAAVTAAMTGNIGSLTGTASLSKASSVASYWDGDIASVLVANRSLTAGEQSSARAYLGTKYGVAF